MQGQRSAIGSLPDSINFDYGSTSSNVGIDQQICWNNLHDPAESRLSDYRITPGATDAYTGTISQEGRNLSRWSTGESSSISLQNPINLESELYEPSGFTSRNGVNLNLNMNESHDSNVGRLETSSSGGGGFLVEEDDGRSGCALDGRRLSCKRKTIEGNAGQSSNTGSSSLNISPQSETSVGANNPDPVNSRLELTMVGVASNSLHNPIAGSGAESSQRNYRVRMNPYNPQDLLPNNSFMSRVPVNPPMELVPPIHPGLRRNIQGARLSGNSRSRVGNLPTSLVSRDGGLNPRPMPRNIPEHPMFVAHNPPNWGLPGGGVGVPEHFGSSSRSRSTSGLNWGGSHRDPPSQYSRRRSEYVRRSLLSSAGPEIGGLGGSGSGHHSVASSSQELVLPSAGGSQGHNQLLPRSGHWMDRHGDGVVGLPYPLRALSGAGEGRSRLVSEIRNVLDIVRRGEGLRFEDVMILDPFVFFGMADIHDRHRDMRLDVDNMSYEELLALEERIGNVCTGLSAETIAARMKQRKYVSVMKDDQSEVEPCCICQEEYSDGEDLGTLDCGHDFHTECIKQWLAQKNLCPICKTTALST